MRRKGETLKVWSSCYACLADNALFIFNKKDHLEASQQISLKEAVLNDFEEPDVPFAFSLCGKHGDEVMLSFLTEENYVEWRRAISDCILQQRDLLDTTQQENLNFTQSLWRQPSGMRQPNEFLSLIEFEMPALELNVLKQGSREEWVEMRFQELSLEIRNHTFDFFLDVTLKHLQMHNADNPKDRVLATSSPGGGAEAADLIQFSVAQH